MFNAHQEGIKFILIRPIAERPLLIMQLILKQDVAEYRAAFGNNLYVAATRPIPVTMPSVYIACHNWACRW